MAYYGVLCVKLRCAQTNGVIALNRLYNTTIALPWHESDGLGITPNSP